MKTLKKAFVYILAFVLCINVMPLQPAFASSAENTNDIYENNLCETVNIEGINYSFQYHYENGNRVITVTNDRDNTVDKVTYNESTNLLSLNYQLLIYEEEGWVIKSSGSHRITWAQGTSVALVAAAIAIKLGSLSSAAAVIAAVGVGALGVLAAAATGGTIYIEIQQLTLFLVNQQRIVWTFTASTGDFYGPFYDYIKI